MIFKNMKAKQLEIQMIVKLILEHALEVKLKMQNQPLSFFLIKSYFFDALTLIHHALFLNQVHLIFVIGNYA